MYAMITMICCKMSIDEAEIVSIKRNSYRIYWWGVSKEKASCLLKKVNLNHRVKVNSY